MWEGRDHHPTVGGPTEISAKGRKGEKRAWQKEDWRFRQMAHQRWVQEEQKKEREAAGEQMPMQKEITTVPGVHGLTRSAEEAFGTAWNVGEDSAQGAEVSLKQQLENDLAEREKQAELRKKLRAERLLREEEEHQREEEERRLQREREEEERKNREALELEEERKEIEELSRQRDLIRADEEKALQRETLLVEEKKATTGVSSEDFCPEMQLQIDFLLDQQAVMQQNFSTVVRDFKSQMVTEMKTALRDIMAGSEHLPQTSTRMEDAPHSPPLLEPAVLYVAPPQLPLPQYMPRLPQHPLQCCWYQLRRSVCSCLRSCPCNLLCLRLLS